MINFQSPMWQFLLNVAAPTLLFILFSAYISWAVAWLFAKHPRDPERIAEPKGKSNAAREAGTETA